MRKLAFPFALLIVTAAYGSGCSSEDEGARTGTTEEAPTGVTSSGTDYAFEGRGTPTGGGGGGRAGSCRSAFRHAARRNLPAAGGQTGRAFLGGPLLSFRMVKGTRRFIWSLATMRGCASCRVRIAFLICSRTIRRTHSWFDRAAGMRLRGSRLSWQRPCGWSTIDWG